MNGRRAAFAVAALLAAGCATVRPVAPSEADRVRGAWDRARSAAWSPRRVKAMFKGDVSPAVGAVAHGYLLVWWDGRTLVWRASAPLAGSVRSGTLVPGAETGPNPFAGRLRPGDAIGVLLGALDVPATARPVEKAGDRYRLFLDSYGRTAVMGSGLEVVGLELPDRTRVTYEPGEGLPRRIEAVSRDGRAHLSLESLVAWPEDEPIPPAG